MYEYHPQFKKKKEKLLACFLAALGVVLYFSARIPGVLIPGVIQILAVCSFAGSILVISMCVLRSYSYQLTEGEDGRIDFLITEFYSRRKTVVCRVGLDEVISVAEIDTSKQGKAKSEKEKEKVYTYTGVLFDEKRYRVEICTQNERIFVIICADQTLLDILAKR